MVEKSLLSLNREFITGALAAIGDGIIISDFAGKIMYVNASAAKITGWGSAEAVGRDFHSVFNIYDSVTNEPAPNPISRVIEAMTVIGLKEDYIFISKEGRQKYLSATFAPIQQPGEGLIGIVVVFRDVTKYRLLEENCKNEEANLRCIFNAMPVGMCIVDADVVIHQINVSAGILLGDERGEVIGKRFGDALGCKGSFEDERGCGYGAKMCKACEVRQAVLLGFKGLSTDGIEYQHSRGVAGKEKLFWFHASITPVVIGTTQSVVVALVDITARKIAEEGLNRYKLLAEKARDIILFIDRDSHNILEANEAAALAYGYTRDELTELTIFDLYPKDLIKAEQQAQANSKSSYFETTHRRKDGTLFFVEANSQGATIAGKPVVVSIIRDVSERKKADEILKKAKEDAERAYKVKSEFLANMSHEIRTPINGIVGMVDLTLLTDVNAEQKENLVTAKSCAKSLLGIINDILDFSKMEAGKLVIESIDFELNGLIDEIIVVHSANALRKGLRLATVISPDLSNCVAGDPHRLRQVLNNLIGNAIKFTESGSVILAVSQASLTKQDVELTFTVADTGIGIANEEQDKLFQSFSQVDGSITRRFGGTGLGLTISKRLIEIMGGNIWVESVKGQGSTFGFTLPYRLVETLSLQPKRQAISMITKMPLNILVVEDDVVSRTAVMRFLNKMGHSGVAVENGLEALALLEHNKYSLILMDIQLPKLDGIETTKRIRQAELRTGEHVPIVALTAHALLGDRERFLKLGMDHYLAKPIQMTELFQELEDISAKWNNKNQKSSGDLWVSGTGDIVYGAIKRDNDKSSKAATFDEMEKLITQFLSGMQFGDLEVIEGIAHKIKVLANKIDVDELKNVAFKAELAARRENVAAAMEQFVQIKKLIAVFRKK